MGEVDRCREGRLEVARDGGMVEGGLGRRDGREQRVRSGSGRRDGREQRVGSGLGRRDGIEQRVRSRAPRVFCFGKWFTEIFSVNRFPFFPSRFYGQIQTFSG